MEKKSQFEVTAALLDEIRTAIKGLSKSELYRLDRAARACLFGTEFREPREVIHEAIMRAMRGTRCWPRPRVSFMAFLIESMRSIADASRQSPEQARTQPFDVSVMEGGLLADSLWTTAVASPEEIHIELEREAERQTHAAMDIAKITRHFEDDARVRRLISCLEFGRSGHEICTELGWSETEYATVRKRLRRGLAKLFPSRRPQ